MDEYPDDISFTHPSRPGVVFFMHRGPLQDGPEVPENWVQTAAFSTTPDDQGNYPMVYCVGGILA